MLLFLSGYNTSALKTLDEAIQILAKVQEQKSKQKSEENLYVMLFAPPVSDCDAIEEVMTTLLLIKKHIKYIIRHPFYSNDHISQLLLGPTNTNTPIKVDDMIQKDYIRCVIDKAVTCNAPNVYFQIVCAILFIGFFVFAVHSTVGIILAIKAFQAPMDIPIILCTVGWLGSFISGGGLHLKTNAFNAIQDELRRTQRVITAPDEPSTFDRTKVYNHFFNPDERGISLASQILSIADTSEVQAVDYPWAL